MNNEPVAWQVWNRTGGISLRFTKPDALEYVEYDPLYTHPAKTLTDEEITAIWYEPTLRYDPVAFARAILRKAQEK
jgi:hypothetical protein